MKCAIWQRFLCFLIPFSGAFSCFATDTYQGSVKYFQTSDPNYQKNIDFSYIRKNFSKNEPAQKSWGEWGLATQMINTTSSGFASNEFSLLGLLQKGSVAGFDFNSTLGYQVIQSNAQSPQSSVIGSLKVWPQSGAFVKSIIEFDRQYLYYELYPTGLKAPLSANTLAISLVAEPSTRWQITLKPSIRQHFDSNNRLVVDLSSSYLFNLAAPKLTLGMGLATYNFSKRDPSYWTPMFWVIFGPRMDVEMPLGDLFIGNINAQLYGFYDHGTKTPWTFGYYCRAQIQYGKSDRTNISVFFSDYRNWYFNWNSLLAGLQLFLPI